MFVPEKAAQRMGIESTKTKYVGKVPAPIFTCCTWVNKYALEVRSHFNAICRVMLVHIG